MTSYEGQCHCGQTTWTAQIPEEKHILCHCSACKVLGGGEYTLNQVIPRDNLRITNGTLKRYTYKGDSGMPPFSDSGPPYPIFPPPPALPTWVHVEFTHINSLSPKGNSVDCFHCPNCTAHAYHHQHVMGDKLVIRTALLKGTEKWGKPGAEVFGVQKWAWQPQTADQIFDTTPPS